MASKNSLIERTLLHVAINTASGNITFQVPQACFLIGVTITGYTDAALAAGHVLAALTRGGEYEGATGGTEQQTIALLSFHTNTTGGSGQIHVPCRVWLTTGRSLYLDLNESANQTTQVDFLLDLEPKF